MPWVTERQCYGVPSDWDIWNYCDSILDSYQIDTVLVTPYDAVRYMEDRLEQARNHLDQSPNNRVVTYNFFDPFEGDHDFESHGLDPSRCTRMPHDQICMWEYYLSNKCENYADQEIPTTFPRHYMCYQRKPNHYRPHVYRTFRHDPNGLVTLGTVDNPQVNHNVHPDNDAPGDISITGDSSLRIHADTASLGNWDIWQDTFMIFVSETVREPDVWCSEKSFKPFMGKRPFITIGAADSYYQRMRDRGYYTFEQDFSTLDGRCSTNDLLRRMAVVVEEIRHLDRDQYYVDNLDKIVHNYNNLRQARNAIPQRYKQFLEEVASSVC
jgi:hypothetical protein